MSNHKTKKVILQYFFVLFTRKYDLNDTTKFFLFGFLIKYALKPFFESRQGKEC